MNVLKGFFKLIPAIISFLPFLFLIGIVVLVILCIKNKVRIKFRTFRGKGFRPVRGNFGLYTYSGKQGVGKTYSLAEYLFDNKDNITVFNNIAKIKGLDYFHFSGFKELLYIKEILDYNYSSDDDLLSFISSKFEESRAYHFFKLIKSYYSSGNQLVIVYDEIFTEIIKGDKLSKPVIDFLCQMRKRKIIFLTTCQEWAELPLSFRRFCRYQIDCDMKPFLWTGFLIKTFKDAENMKWSNEEQEHIAPIVETTISKCRKSVADSYDTFLRISSVSLPSASTTPQGKKVGSEESPKNAHIPSFLK